MIGLRIPVPVTVEPREKRDRRQRWWVAALIVVALLATAGLLVPLFASVAPPAPSASASPPAPPLRSAAPPAPAPSATATPVTVPTHGSGRFAYATGRGKVLGRKGTLRRFRVAVEKGSKEDPQAFAAQVEATLGDKRSWIGSADLRLQRVAGGDAATFTVYLATRETAGHMCRQGGTNITVYGRPYTSCRTTGRAIINLDRWRLAAKPYLKAKVPLAVYRQYVINHEVGHELGHRHEGCPKRGGPAPVMVQQTLTLRGCVPYAWPRRGGHNFRGPTL